jgi:sugar phosphate isomerase/epimerase
MNKLLLALFFASVSFGLTRPAHAVAIPDDCRIGGFAVSCQAWSFNRYTVMEAIERCAKTGAKCIEFFPGQPLSPDDKDQPKDKRVKWDHNASDEVIAKVKAKLAEHKIRAVNYGVVGIPGDEAGARKIFEFAKKMELWGVTTESTGSIEVISKLAKEYDIHVGFHDHPKQPNNPKYRMWDPDYILEVCKDKDERVGSCADTGHWITSGLDPVECVKKLAGKIQSSHLKDRAVSGKGSPDIIYGTGVGKVAEVLAEFKKQNLQGNISIEYEAHWEDNIEDMKKCVDFIREWAEKNK